jgi:hypothetical protein
MVGNMFGNQFETPSWMQELLWRMQMDQQNADSGTMGQNASMGQSAERGQQPQTPKLLPEGHPYRRFMKNPLAGLDGDPMVGKEEAGIVPEGHPYRKFMKNPQGARMMTEQTPSSKLLPEGHPYRKFMKDPLVGLPIQEILPLSGSGSELQAPQKGNRAQQIQEIKAMTGLNEEEKNRALGMMLVKLFAGMAQPGHGDGVGGALSALAQNMGGAIDAYAGEEGRLQDLNTRLYGHIDNKEMEQQKAWNQMLEKLQDQLHKKEQFDETKRHNLKTEENTHNNAEATRLYREMMLDYRQDKTKEGEKQKQLAKIQNYLNGTEAQHIMPALEALYRGVDLLANPDKKKSPLTAIKKFDWMKSNEEKDFDQSGQDALRELSKVLKYTQADQRSLSTLESTKNANDNLNAFKGNYRLLEPKLHEYLRYETQKQALETGEDADVLYKKRRNEYAKKYNAMLEKLSKQGAKG